jgi:hypothetical protein
MQVTPDSGFLLSWRWRVCIRSSPSLPFPPFRLPCREAAPLNQLGGLGERCELPSGSGRSPAAKRFWCLLWAEKWLMLVLNIHYFILVIQL